MKGERDEETRERGNERRESEGRVRGRRGIWLGGGVRAEAWRGEDCSYCRGGPTATYKLHSYKCLSVFLHRHTCKCEHKPADVANVWIYGVHTEAV